MQDLLIEIERLKDGKFFRIGEGQWWRFKTKGLDGFGSYTNKINYEDNAVFDGGTITGTNITKVNRTIKCAYLNLSNNVEERKNVLGFFNPKEDYRVYITNAGRKVWADGMVYKYALSMDAQKIDRLDLTITFTFANPYFKSYENYGKDIALKTGKIAFPYMVATTPGLTGGIFNFSKRVNIINSGDIDTRCKAIITASDEVVNPLIFINDEYVKVLDTLEKGDVIEMDFTILPPTVKKNGENYLGHCDRTSSFFDMILSKGENDIGFDADDGDSHLSVTVYYNNLYSAI